MLREQSIIRLDSRRLIVVKKLTIRSYRKPAVVINRSAVATKRLVYIAVANKKRKYTYGRSKIVYIGTTQAGASRVASSAASKAKQLLGLYGVTHLEFHVLSCSARQNVETWKKLERGLLIEFREMYGDIAECNKQGNRMKWRDELTYFTKRRLRSIIQEYS